MIGLTSFYSVAMLFLYLVFSKYANAIGYTHVSTITIKVFINYFEDSPLVIVMVALTIPVAFYLFMYVLLELYGITYNITVNEAFNRHRYRYLYTPYRFTSGNFGLRYINPFSKGVIKNWVEFLAGVGGSEIKVS